MAILPLKITDPRLKGDHCGSRNEQFLFEARHGGGLPRHSGN
jgi:hypothetical protein